MFDELNFQVPVSDKAYETALLEAAVVTSQSSHDAERPNLGDLGRLPTFNDLSGDTLSSKSATVGVINSPIVDSDSYFPPIDSDDDMISAQDSFNHFSFESDNSVDDEYNDSGSLDTLLSSASCSTVTGTLQSSKLLPHSYGLGISGLMRKDGSGSFDGLGIVSIKSSAWRHDDLSQSEILQFRDGIEQLDSIQDYNRQSPSSSTYEGSLDSDDFDSSLLVGSGDTGISDVFLQQTLLTFTQDPFHQLCSSIPDCDDNSSWSELGLGLGDDESASTTSISELLPNDHNTHSTKDDSRPRVMSNYSRRRVPKLSTHFSSATISSELKRSSTTAVIPKKKMRHRSSSWPSAGNMDGTVAATSLARCKWRL